MKKLYSTGVLSATLRRGATSQSKWPLIRRLTDDVVNLVPHFASFPKFPRASAQGMVNHGTHFVFLEKRFCVSLSLRVMAVRQVAHYLITVFLSATQRRGVNLGSHFVSSWNDFASDCLRSKALACGAVYAYAPHATTKLMRQYQEKAFRTKCETSLLITTNTIKNHP